MRIYIVEGMTDPIERKDHARAVVLKHYPDAELIGGAGSYPNNAVFRSTYKKEVESADILVTIRRTLALGGTIEVEHALNNAIPVYTVNGKRLQEITFLWYADPDCLQHLDCEHNGWMHRNPKRVAETRQALKEKIS